MTKITLTAAEAAFISRMADYIVAHPGTSMDDAARAVQARDLELLVIATSKTEEGETIRETMMRDVYKRARARR